MLIFGVHKPDCFQIIPPIFGNVFCKSVSRFISSSIYLQKYAVKRGVGSSIICPYLLFLNTVTSKVSMKSVVSILKDEKKAHRYTIYKSKGKERTLEPPKQAEKTPLYEHIDILSFLKHGKKKEKKNLKKPL